MKTIIIHGASGQDQRVTVDDSDFDLISQYRWYLHKGSFGNRRLIFYARGYRIGSDSTKKILMHRLILGAAAAEQVDHKNGDGLDNRRENLRFCSRSENMRNQAERGIPNRTKSRKGPPVISLPVTKEMMVQVHEAAVESERSIAGYIRDLIREALAKRTVSHPPHST